VRRCRHCPNSLSPLARADARYCSGRCRIAAHRSRGTLPAELVALNRWVRYSPAKVPLTVDGSAASSTKRRTWSTYEDAEASAAGVGLGFVLNGDGVICIDVDHCITDGQIAEWVQAFLRSLPDTYVEVSPSGDGLHVWGVADLNFTGRRIKIDGGHLEVYGNLRYLTVTGDALTSARHLGDLTKAVAALG
jgi:primase-polymerase (primpol)-like protein